MFFKLSSYKEVMRLSSKSKTQEQSKPAFNPRNPLVEDSINSYSDLLAKEYFKGKGDVYEVKRIISSAAKRGVGRDELIEFMKNSIDVRQFVRYIFRRTNQEYRPKTATLPLSLTEVEERFMRNVLKLNKREIDRVCNGTASMKTLHKAYSNILAIEPFVVGKYYSQQMFDEKLFNLCEYLGLDGQKPQHCLRVTRESAVNMMEVLTEVAEDMAKNRKFGV